MQVDDCERSPLADAPFPESGRFVNPNPKRKRSVSERIYRFLERVRFVVPVTRQPAQRRGGRSIKTMSELSR